MLRLRRSKSYLEWGSGGSTVLAARMGVPFVSIESDRAHLSAVAARIRSETPGPKSSQRFIHADIGSTGAWGYPALDGEPSALRAEAFRRYSDFPRFELTEPFPDLVLVDGRFRVACSLKALRALSARNLDSLLLVDDYGVRSHYREIARHASQQTQIGNLAVFRPRGTATEALHAAIERYELDSR